MSDFKYYRPDNFPPIVKNLIIINILVWVAQQFFRDQHLSERISLFPVMPQELFTILSSVGIYKSYEGFQPYQIATHMFAHGPIYHIIFNMFALWMFGRILENVWGPKRFLLFYLVCGVGAAACHLLVQYFRCQELLHQIQANPGWFYQIITTENDPRIYEIIGPVSAAVGASGAIMGIFAAFGYLFPNTELYIMFIPIPVKAKWAVIGLAAIDLFGGFANVNGDNIAHFAHLGGALTGFILVLIWNRKNRKRFY
jgi:membrane associated rhomboid family serine protease